MIRNLTLYATRCQLQTCKKCQNSFPTRIVIEGRERNLCNRKFCLSCSPFNKHNTRNLIVVSVSDEFLLKKLNEPKFCLRCSQNKPADDFYKCRKKIDKLAYCKTCTKQETLERQRRFKQQCIDYKGGKCEICDYNRCIAALEFHHLNPESKDFLISGRYSLTDKVKNELDKCQLCCAVCHREIHWNQHNSKYPR